MFLLDSLMISGIRWALETVVTAAEAEMNDDTALRDQLLVAEMQREGGEITDERFAEIEADLLGRIREIKERREGGAGPLAFGAGTPMETSPDSRFQIEASVEGDFHGEGTEDATRARVIDPVIPASVAPAPAALPRRKRADRTSASRRPSRPARRARGKP